MAKQLSPEKSAEFDALLGFLAHFDKFGWVPPRTVTPDLRADVAAIEAQHGKSKALVGLRMALGDLLEMTSSRSVDWVTRFDGGCRAARLKTLSEYRVSHWAKYRRVLERGRISNVEQFYMLTAVLADLTLPLSTDDRMKLEEMVMSYGKKSV